MAPGGYAWWYLDALSSDGRHALTVIAFIGSVFSPYYAWRRAADPAADPTDHCAVNVALYSPGAGRWAMTERGRGSLATDATHLSIGPSALHWDGDSLCIDVDEIAVPLPSRVRGRIRVHPHALFATDHPLDAAGRHLWRPIAPAARVEVDLSSPDLRWQGEGYVDSNRGAVPLEDDFVRWDWCRAALGNRRSGVFYDVVPAKGPPRSLALRFDESGTAAPLDALQSVSLPPTRWRIGRVARGDGPQGARISRSLEDAPFYARTLLSADWHGQRVSPIHETLSLTRFSASWVRMLLPFRMPRRR